MPFESHSVFLVVLPGLGGPQWNAVHFQVSNVAIVFVSAKPQTPLCLSLKISQLLKNLPGVWTCFAMLIFILLSRSKLLSGKYLPATPLLSAEHIVSSCMTFILLLKWKLCILFCPWISYCCLSDAYSGADLPKGKAIAVCTADSVLQLLYWSKQFRSWRAFVSWCQMNHRCRIVRHMEVILCVPSNFFNGSLAISNECF